MTDQPMRGVKMVEVAQFTFTPAAGAVLADWGADVIKVEHAVTGDAQRGLTLGTGGAAAGSFQPLMEHPNRGKRSIGLDLQTPGGHAVLLDLVRDADIFLDQFPARRAASPEARGRGHPGRPTRTSSTCGGAATASAAPTPRRAATTAPRSGAGSGSAVVGDPVRQPPGHQPAGRRVRRLDRRHDDRGRDRRRAVRAGAHRRALGGRRVAHERRRVDDGALARQRDAHRTRCSSRRRSTRR